MILSSSSIRPEREHQFDPGAPSPNHPIVAAALSAHGLTVEDILGHEAWAKGQSLSYGDSSGDLPRVVCSRRDVRVYRKGPDDSIVFYMNEDVADPRPCFWLNQLEFRNWMPPETVLSALIGRTIDDLVDLPGGRGIRILDAVEMARGLVLTLEHQS